MKTLIEDLKKVITSDIVDKDKYCEKLINGFLTERDSEQLIIHGVVNQRELLIDFQCHRSSCNDALVRPELMVDKYLKSINSL